MNGRHYLIRIFSSSTDNWLEDSPKIEVLAKIFDLADSEQSVYEVADGEEEWSAVAAHLIASKRVAENQSILRIDREHLSRFQITVDHAQFGATGIPRWDCRHGNLIASREQLLDLVRFLAGRCHCGHDEVRRIAKKFVDRRLKEFCTLPSCQCPNHVKEIAQFCLTKTASTPAISQIRQEMAAVEFEDESIRPGAEALSSGDMIRDWYISLEELRRRYADHYIPQVAKRFGLTRRAEVSIAEIPNTL